MADIVAPEMRSRMMAGIRGKDTKPEMLVRRGLHAQGFRFRLHDRKLPGCPDLVFPKHRAVIFVHGCFWHGHDCHLFRWPKTRVEWWREKITRNQQTDARTICALDAAGWRSGVIWECALKGSRRWPMGKTLEICSSWLSSDEPSLEIRSSE
jgi:DNA mismatch endonuclease (patch repair protein)